jgi:hypothetical protein
MWHKDKLTSRQSDTERQNKFFRFSLNSSAHREILQKSCAPVIRRVILKTWVSDPDLIRIQSGQWIRIRIRNPDPDLGGQK